MPSRASSFAGRRPRKLLSVVLVQICADGYSAGRVNCRRVEINMLDGPILVDDERSAPREFVFVSIHGIGADDSILAQHFTVHIAEQRKRDANLLRKCGVRGGAVDADAENN